MPNTEMPQPGIWTEPCPKPKDAVELGRNVALVKTRVKCRRSWSSDWNIHHLTVNATEKNIWSPESYRIILLSWKTSSTKRHVSFSNREATLGVMKISLQLLGLDWWKMYSIGIFQITTSKKLCSKYWCAFICMYIHLKDLSLQMEARTRNLLVGKQTLLPRVTDNTTSKSHCARQHL